MISEPTFDYLSGRNFLKINIFFGNKSRNLYEKLDV